jgi:hypothetical protein
MREILAHNDRPKTRRLLRQAGYDLLNPSTHQSQIPRAVAADRIGSVDCTSGGTLLVPTEHGGRRPAALRQWIALLLSICASTLRFAKLQSLQRIGMPPAIPGRSKLRRA